MYLFKLCGRSTSPGDGRYVLFECSWLLGNDDVGKEREKKKKKGEFLNGRLCVQVLVYYVGRILLLLSQRVASRVKRERISCSKCWPILHVSIWF